MSNPYHSDIGSYYQLFSFSVYVFGGRGQVGTFVLETIVELVQSAFHEPEETQNKNKVFTI